MIPKDYHGEENEEIFDKMVNSSDDTVRGTVEKYKIKEYLKSNQMDDWKSKEIFHKMMSDSCRDKTTLAICGGDSHRDILIASSTFGDFGVKAEIAKYGNHNHRNILIKHRNEEVRINVATYGNDEHRNILIRDKDPMVRRAVAEHGNDEHRRILLCDKNPLVREAAEIYGKQDFE